MTLIGVDLYLTGVNVVKARVVNDLGNLEQAYIVGYDFFKTERACDLNAITLEDFYLLWTKSLEFFQELFIYKFGTHDLPRFLFHLLKKCKKKKTLM